MANIEKILYVCVCLLVWDPFDVFWPIFRFLFIFPNERTKRYPYQDSVTQFLLFVSPLYREFIHTILSMYVWCFFKLDLFVYFLHFHLLYSLYVFFTCVKLSTNFFRSFFDKTIIIIIK